MLGSGHPTHRTGQDPQSPATRRSEEAKSAGSAHSLPQAQIHLYASPRGTTGIGVPAVLHAQTSYCARCATSGVSRRRRHEDGSADMD